MKRHRQPVTFTPEQRREIIRLLDEQKDNLFKHFDELLAATVKVYEQKLDRAISWAADYRERKRQHLAPVK